jgi:hypothetical protein
MQWLGAISYPLYLWHWPALVLPSSALGRPLRIRERIFCIVLTIVLAHLTSKFVEQPLRHRKFSAKKIYGFFAATTAISLLAGVVVASTASSIINVKGTNYSFDLKQVVAKPAVYADGCHVNYGEIESGDCTYGVIGSPTKIVLYGDSHAAQWFPAFEKVAIKRKWKLITYTKRGCPPAEIPTYSSVLGKVYKECAPWRRNVLDQMVADGVQVVFVAHFERLLSASTRKPMWQKEWREGLQGTVTEIESRGMKPVLMQDTPYPGQDIPTCLSRSYTNIQQCSPSVRVAYRDDMNEMLVDFDRSGQQVLWVRDWFCITTSCPTVVGNVLVYRDDNHMTVTFASLIAPLLDAATFEFVEWYARTP